MKINVKNYVENKKAEIKKLDARARLLIIQIGDNTASNSYIKGKIKDCAEVGFETTLIKFSENTTGNTIEHFIYNYGKYYNGIILQEPAVLNNKENIIKRIEPKQDVDGFKRDSEHKPCTPLGIINFLKDYLNTDNFKGKIIAVVGKGSLVGKPLVPMLMELGATVISCNSTTPDLGGLTKQADIVVSAVGKQNLITREMIKDGAIVVDAGILTDENGKLCGDCDKNMYDDPDIFITTVPGGVGLLTRLTLLQNLSDAK